VPISLHWPHYWPRRTFFFRHSVFLCSLMTLLMFWNSQNFICILQMQICKFTTTGRGIYSEVESCNIGNIYWVLFRNFFLVTISSRMYVRQSKLVLLSTTIWVRLNMLVLSALRSMGLLLGFLLIVCDLLLHSWFHFHLLRLCILCTWLLFTEETYGGF
jgi:hypothetical protein